MLDTTNELVPNQKGMTSLEIAEVTGKRHDSILRDIRNILKQGVSAHNFVEGTYKDANQQDRPCFNLTPKGCLILASGYDVVLREKIIDRLENLENQKRELSRKQLAIMVIQSEEEKERLEQEKKQLEEQNSKLKPKADFVDAAFQAENSKVDIGMAAKILRLGYGRNTLFAKLKEVGVFFSNKNEPKQRYVDAGYFEMTEKFINRKEHPGFVVAKVLVTQKGLAYINYLFGGKPSDGKITRII